MPKDRKFFSILDDWESSVKDQQALISGDASLATQEFGLAQHEEALNRNTPASDDGSYINQAQSEAFAAIAAGGASGMMSLNLSHQKKQLSEAKDLVGQIESDLDALDGLFDDVPEHKEDKAALRKAVDDIQQQVKNFQPSQDEEAVQKALEKLAEKIGADDIEEFLDNHTIVSGHSLDSVGQRVQQLRENYYRVSKGAQKPPLSFDPGITITGPDGDEVLGTAGFDEATLNPDGTVVVSGGEDGLAQSQNQEMSVGSTQTSGRTVPNNSSQGASIGDLPSVKDDYKFEVWACLVLSLADDIYSLYEQVTHKIRQGLRSFDVIGKILKNKPIDRAIRKAQQDMFQAAARLSTSSKELAVSYGREALPDQLVGYAETVQDSFGSTGGGTSLCKDSMGNYCSVRRMVNKYEDLLENEFKAVIDDLGIDFDANTIPNAVNIEEVLDGVHDEYLKIFDALDDLDEKAGDLKAEVCEWIKQRMSGKPRSLGQLYDVLALLTPAIQALIGLLGQYLQDLIPEDSLEDLEETWRSIGLESAADKLAQGDLIGLMEMNEGTATYAGKAADMLQEYSVNTLSRRAEAELTRLANAARAKDEQISTELSIREKMRKKRHKKTGLSSMRAIKRDSKTAIERMHEDDEEVKKLTQSIYEPVDAARDEEGGYTPLSDNNEYPGTEEVGLAPPDSYEEPPPARLDGAARSALFAMGDVDNISKVLENDDKGLFKAEMSDGSTNFVSVNRRTEEFDIIDDPMFSEFE